jgi:hypothetical protein
VHHGSISALLHPQQQLSNPAIGQLQLRAGLALRQVALPHFVQNLQSISISLREQQLLLFHPAILPVSRGTFHFAGGGTSHFAATENFAACRGNIRMS